MSSIANPIAGVEAKVNTRSSEMRELLPHWELVTALLGGTTAMRKAKTAYLPKFEAEEQKSYDTRLASSTLFPAFKRTVITLAARPFSKPITLNDDVPPDVKALTKDIDLQGNNIDAFMAEQFKGQMAYGMIGILVEHAPRPDDATSKADDVRLGLRPYWVRVYAQQLLGHRTKMVNGKLQLTQLRIMECVEEDDGLYGTKKIEQVRVLEPGKWSTHRKVVGTEDDWAQHEEGTNTLKAIPFVLLAGERTGFMTAKPPLLELAHLNVKHWQQQSDQDSLMHVARVPILTVRGVDDDFKLSFGSSTAVNLKSNPEAEMKYCEHTGAAIEAGKTQLDDLKEEMRQSGAELLVLRPGPTTATEVASDNAVGMCALQEMTLSTQDGVNQALLFTAQYLGLENGGTVDLFKDFAAATLAEASAALLLQMANAGKLSITTLINELKRRGILGQDVEAEKEQDLLADEGPPEPPQGKIDPLTGLPYTEPAPPVAKGAAK